MSWPIGLGLQLTFRSKPQVPYYCPGYSISIFILGDSQKTPSVLTSSNMMPMMTSLVSNLVYSSSKTSFVDFTTSISPSSTNPVPSWTSSSQFFSSTIQTTLANDTGILTYISSVNTIFFTSIFATTTSYLKCFIVKK